MKRRDVLLMGAAATVGGGYQTRSKTVAPMYGLIGKITATAGHRDELIEILIGLPAVREAIAKGRPLIAGFSNRVETVPVGGVGL